MKEFDVIIIGGGITGAGTARDCALRGLRTLLIERDDIACGASGRNHGLLHSGARYAVNDPESATECIKENMILRRIARNCVDPTDGLFISLPEDGLDYQANFIAKCKQAGIRTEVLSPKKALALEPAVNPALIGAVRVPDASVDPFRLVAANVLDARLHGAEVMTRCEVTSLIMDGATVKGVKVLDKATGQTESIYAYYVVNAAGIWGAHIAELAGVKIGMLPSKGTLLVFNHRVARMVINRCRKPANADILVPGDVVSVIGTTSDKVPFEQCDDMRATKEEVELLLREGCQLVPELANTRIIRAYAGVRPLVASDDDPSGRNVSRGIVLLDHAVRDNVRGFISITGGKLTSYRLMAEMTTDLICKKLGMEKACRTAELYLPGSEPDKTKATSVVMLAAKGRHGNQVAAMTFDEKGSEVVCECEQVSRAEISYAVNVLGVRTLDDLRRRTRVGMGPCQSCYCVKKAAQVLAEELGEGYDAESLEREYLQQRWKGIAPVCWGDTLAEAELLRKKYGK